MNDDEFGYVPTPPTIADYLAQSVLCSPPAPGDRILYPGAGEGNLAAAVHRACSVNNIPAPDAVAVERDPEHIPRLRDRFVGPDATANHGVPPFPEGSWHRERPGLSSHAPIDADFTIHQADFLRDAPEGPFDYIVANPPYTYYTQIDEADRESYAEQFETATGKFHLYIPFVEQMLDLLAADGVLVFLAPVRYLTLDPAKPLRQRLRHESPCTPRLIPSSAFPNHKIQTVETTVFRPGSGPAGAPSPPSETRFYLTLLPGWDLSSYFDELGVPEDKQGAAVGEYKDRLREWQRRIRWQDREDRADLDTVDVGTDAGRQTALGSGRWSA